MTRQPYLQTASVFVINAEVQRHGGVVNMSVTSRTTSVALTPLASTPAVPALMYPCPRLKVTDVTPHTRVRLVPIVPREVTRVLVVGISPRLTAYDW
jgi:hypothetical protein